MCVCVYKKISKVIAQFLVWTGEWAVGYASEVENTERTGLREGKEHRFWICMS